MADDKKKMTPGEAFAEMKKLCKERMWNRVKGVFDPKIEDRLNKKIEALNKIINKKGPLE